MEQFFRIFLKFFIKMFHVEHFNNKKEPLRGKKLFFDIYNLREYWLSLACFHIKTNFICNKSNKLTVCWFALAA